MVNIGEFARLGGVSTRMLRHYDALGLLVPADVDAHTGRRSYDVAQLTVLNQLVALKGLGFSLDEVGGLLRQGVAQAELHGMLRLREAELEREARKQRHTLDRVRARLRLIEQETRMNVETKYVEALTIASLTAPADDASRESTGAVVQALFDQVIDRIEAASGDRTTPIAHYRPTTRAAARARIRVREEAYESAAAADPRAQVIDHRRTGEAVPVADRPNADPDPNRDADTDLGIDPDTDLDPDADGDADADAVANADADADAATVQVTAGYALSGGSDSVPDLDSYRLPATEVASVVHHGPMDTISTAYQELARWAEATGRAGSDFVWREHYLEADGEDQTNWIVEVQLELG